MPGLFDQINFNAHPAGILGDIASGFSPALAQQQFAREQYANQLANQQLNFNVLNQGGYNPLTSAFFTMHPEALDKLIAPQKLEPGDVLNQPFPVPGMSGAPSPAAASPSAGVTPGAASSSGNGSTLAANNTGLMSQETLKGLAERGILGEDVQGSNQLGMGKLGVINKTNLQNMMNDLMKRDNITPQEMAARKAKFPAFAEAMKRQTKIEQQMGTGGIEFQKLWQQFAGQMQRSGMTTRFPSLNALDQFMREHAGDGGVVALKAYLNGLENTYTRAITTSDRGPTVDAHAHIREILSRFWGPNGLQEAGKAFNNEIQAARESIPIEGNRLKVQFGLGKKAPADMLTEAQAKIKAGVDKAKILQKMEDMGIMPPEGL